MRARTLLLISVVLNVALLSALVTWLSSAPDHAPRVVRAINTATVISNQVVRILKTNILVRPRTFTWQEVESADYAIYIENLRQLGMPESTIRDIIVADVDQIFVNRKRAEAAKQDFEWWRSSPSAEMQSNLVLHAQAIERERQTLLTKLLGADWQKGRVSAEPMPLGLAGPVLGALPDEVKASVQHIAERARTRMASYVSQMQTAGQALNPVEMARLRDDTRQQLATVLNPTALEEFLLRYSDNASQLRDELTGLNPSPEEFRSIFRSVDGIDRNLQLRGSSQTLEQERLAAIRSALGPQRFEAYQTLQDPAYRDALVTVAQSGGDQETALALYKITRGTSEDVIRIRSDTTLTDAQKEQQILAAEADLQRVRAAVLGETPAVEATSSVPPVPPQPPLREHQVTPGDNLQLLALRYGVSPYAIRAANPDLDMNRVRAGMVIVIPPPSGESPFPPFPPIPQGVRRQ